MNVSVFWPKKPKTWCKNRKRYLFMKMSWQIFWKLYSLFKNHMDDGQGSSLLTFLLTKRLISGFLHLILYMYICIHMHIYICIHVHVHTCMYIHTCEPSGWNGSFSWQKAENQEINRFVSRKVRRLLHCPSSIWFLKRE